MAKPCALIPTKLETFEQAVQRRRNLTRLLRRRTTVEAACLRLDLAGCHKGARCESAACPVCYRRSQRAFLRELDHFIFDEPVLLRASIIPQGARAKPGELDQVDLGRFVNSRQRALQRCLPRDTIVVGGVDISFNTSEDEEAHWQLHLYLLIGCRDGRETRAAIRRHFPPEPKAARPYFFKEVGPEDYGKVASYATKSGAYWRSGYIDAKGRKNADPRSLKPAQQLELALFRQEYPLQSHYLLKGLKRHKTRNGWRLVRT